MCRANLVSPVALLYLSGFLYKQEGPAAEQPPIGDLRSVEVQHTWAGHVSLTFSGPSWALHIFSL